MTRPSLGLAFIGCAAVTACGGSSSLPPPVVVAAHHAALSRGSLRAATLKVTSGTTTVRVRAADLHGDLLAVSTPPGSGQRPVLTATAGGEVDLQLVSAGAGGDPAGVDVVVDRSVTWALDLAGGATAEVVDMRAGRVSTIALSAGASRETIELPARPGTQVVREVGGTSQLTVTTPAPSESRVEVDGGAGRVQLGARIHTGIGARQVFQDRHYPDAPDRLDVVLQGGVSRVVVRRL